MEIFDNSGSRASQHNSSVPPRKAPFKKGDFIGKKYEVYKLLGWGGCGIVYLERHSYAGRLINLRLTKEVVKNDASPLQRFKGEILRNGRNVHDRRILSCH
jgi:hypothetical protein